MPNVWRAARAYGSTTVIVIESEANGFATLVTVTTVTPFATALTRPVPLTVAAASLLDSYVTLSLAVPVFTNDNVN